MFNLVVIRGRLSRPVDNRVLPSGSRVLALEVTIERADGPAESVPVAWFEAPTAALEWDTGRHVVVVGRVRRRFFKAGGATQSRTEVVADQVIPVSQTKRLRAALAAAINRLDEEDAMAAT
jgi:single-strand DNA-binding protein